jgi:hypothetical protein
MDDTAVTVELIPRDLVVATVATVARTVAGAGIMRVEAAVSVAAALGGGAEAVDVFSDPATSA